MTKKQKKVFRRIVISACLTVITAVLCMPGMPFCGVRAFEYLFLLPYVIIGYDVLKAAVHGIKCGQIFDENFLMATATLGALALGEFTEAVAVMLFYQTGELFQGLAVGKSRRNIMALMELRPDFAAVETENGLEKVDPADVAPGTVIVVQAGERVPIDGVLQDGEAYLDLSALTGESRPKRVSPGDEIPSGCVCMDGVLKISTTKPFGESTVMRILELVESCGMKKSRSEKFISRFARYYTPAVCGMAAFLAFVMPLLSAVIFSQPIKWQQWIYRGLTFLVVSCPCALVISIPLAFFAGIGCAGKNGILIKGSVYIEAMADAGCVVFDKTGTLTDGSFRPAAISAAGCSGEELLCMAAAAEKYSIHPVAQSIKDASGVDLGSLQVSDFKEHSGKGVEAVCGGKRICAGSMAFMRDLGLSCQPAREDGTVVYVAADGKCMGYIVIRDCEKPTAKEAVSRLMTCGVKKVIMLTGDGESAAAATAGRIGIDTYHHSLMPEDKVLLVEEAMKTADGKVIFAGDGINDAPVISRADVGMAMGALGSDAAIEAADVVLMNDDPNGVADAIFISKKCMAIVYENIVFAIGIKLACLALSAVGLAGMWLAIFADVGVMILAVINAMRALGIRTKKR